MQLCLSCCFWIFLQNKSLKNGTNPEEDTLAFLTALYLVNDTGFGKGPLKIRPFSEILAFHHWWEEVGGLTARLPICFHDTRPLQEAGRPFRPLSFHLLFCERGSKANRKCVRLLFPPSLDQDLLVIPAPTRCGFFRQKRKKFWKWTWFQSNEWSCLFCKIIQRKERMWTLLQTHPHTVISTTFYSTGQDDQTGNQLVGKGKRKRCCWTKHRTWPWEHIFRISVFWKRKMSEQARKMSKKNKTLLKNVNLKMWNDNKQSSSYQCKAAHSCICSQPHRRCKSPDLSMGLKHTH